jgi:hypothetical protein
MMMSRELGNSKIWENLFQWCGAMGTWAWYNCSKKYTLDILDGSQFILTGGNEENGGYWRPLWKTLPYKFWQISELEIAQVLLGLISWKKLVKFPKWLMELVSYRRRSSGIDKCAE